eukprot:CAMPEP_0176485224 /NCGR_PEP_ID=MMETSP0200_2-20121128/4928_1 /TAXON_ID=947934 /ORGANISM="Chaetoceros sp., Strain GSL56" /LENGTH=1225 /DNA_ID=CAMNT_0017881859 /DNA_START=99 /DNA_END=3776 /DNA_ORIENTATION=+
MMDHHTKGKILDGETRTSRIIGSVDFHFPPPSESLKCNEDDSNLFRIVSGIRCAMPFTVKVATSTKLKEEDIRDIVMHVFDEIESTLSNWNPSSEVNKVNMLKKGEIHEMSPMLREVVVASKEIVKITRGAFDPSIAPILAHYKMKASYPSAVHSETSSETGSSSVGASASDMDTSRRQRAIIEVWRELLVQGYSSDPKDVKVSKHVKRLLELSQWSSAFSVKDKKFISKKHDEACLDLSGIAKGFAIDEIAKRLPSPCYIEWGGDVKVVGSHPSGRPWHVAVLKPRSLCEIKRRVEASQMEGQVGPVFTLADKHLDEEDSSREYLAIIELNDGDSVATSGDCEKIISKDGKFYSHIISPKLGRLLEINETTLAQAVVVCQGPCMYADAFSTAAISQEVPSLARAMLEPFRTYFRFPLKDFLLYSRGGPRIIRLSIPGIEPKELREKRFQSHDAAKVIVIGSGLAGLSAAIEAADAKAKVLILEKELKTGGNSAKATSGINGWGTNTQAKLNIADDERLFERDTHRSGIGGLTHPSLVRALSTQSAPAVHWLQNKFRIPLDVVSQLGGHSARRTHRAPPDEHGSPVPIGHLIMSTMKAMIEKHYADKIEIRCGSKVTRLLQKTCDDGLKIITGVEVECNGSCYEEFADSVILATGGFGSDNGLMARFRPDLLGVPTTNGKFAQGEGVLLGETVGAHLIDMDKVQLHPTGFINPKDPTNQTKSLAPEAIRGSGGILVNSDGRRFVDELDLRSVVTNAILQNCSCYQDGNQEGPPFAWCILSKSSQEIFGLPAISFYKDKMGLFEHCANVKELSTLIGCDESVLRQTLQDYSNAMKVGNCPLTRKHIFPAELSENSTDLIVARITPSIHYTMGGISINAAGEVQETLTGHFGSHRHIRGLYAAGEVTGGVHGNNRLAGNSLLECCVFGRIAGERAATVKQQHKSLFQNIDSTESNWVPVVLREVKNTDEKYGKNTLEVRFNLHGALQHSGLDVGQFIGLRGDYDGETLQGYFSPITRPDDEGLISILCRVDDKGGPITKIFKSIRPGSIMHMCAMGGLRLKFSNGKISFNGRQVKRIGLLAGGTGIAPMIQIIRAYSDHIRKYGDPAAATTTSSNQQHGLNLIFAAEEDNDLAYMKVLKNVQKDFPNDFRVYVKVNIPPLGWTDGVGFIEPQDVMTHLMYPPEKGDLVVICGPPVFDSAMVKVLRRLGFEPHQWFSYSEQDVVSAKD